MAVKVKSALALYQKFNVTRSTICVESFILVSKSAHKASFLALCHSTTINTLGLRKKIHPSRWRTESGPTRHWVTCGSEPGDGGIFYFFGPFLFHAIICPKV